MEQDRPKPLEWVASSRADLKAFPPEVQDSMGYALFQAQEGGKHPRAKPLRGFGGAGVLEIAEDYDGDTYRAVYTVKFADVVYVLHAFQKKAKRRIATPRNEIELIKARLKVAERHHRVRRQRGERP